MILSVLKLLKEANGETENIRLAQGKMQLPETFKGAFVKYKKERKWQSKK